MLLENASLGIIWMLNLVVFSSTGNTGLLTVPGKLFNSEGAVLERTSVPASWKSVLVSEN